MTYGLPGQRRLKSDNARAARNKATAGRPRITHEDSEPCFPRDLLSPIGPCPGRPLGCLAVRRMALVSGCPSESEPVVERPSLLTSIELKLWSSPTRSGYQARGRPSSAGQWSIRRLSFQWLATQRPASACRLK